MVELTVKLSSKGQVVIPKIWRDYYKMYPEQDVVLQSSEEGVMIKPPRKGIAAELKKLAEEATKRRKGRSFIYKKEEFSEQYEERTKRAGIKV